MRSGFGYVQKLLQIAAAVFIKHYAFVFQNELLFVVWQNNSAGRNFALRVDDTMPRRAIRARVHAKADRPRRVAIAKQLRDLTISHHAA